MVVPLGFDPATSDQAAPSKEVLDCSVPEPVHEMVSEFPLLLTVSVGLAPEMGVGTTPTR